jgi:hypothetical protein
MQNKPYIVLKVYRPKENKCLTIGQDLTNITKELGFIPFKNDEIKRNEKAAWFDYELHAEVRKTAVRGSEAEDFHMDGDTSTNDMDFAMIVWADNAPTQFKFNKKIYQPKPFELVIARNLSCYHRRPHNIQGDRRFFRQRVEVPKHIKLKN